MNVQTFGFLIMAGSVFACAVPYEMVDPVAPPSSREVETYVQSHWASYAERVSRFASREGQKPDLVSIDRVECGSYYGYPDCRITVNTRFPDGFEYQRVLQSMFDRNDQGVLFETIIMVHDVVDSSTFTPLAPAATS